MPTYAVIRNSLVVDAILCDSLEHAEELTGSTCIETNEASVGFMYDEETGIFTPVSNDPTKQWDHELGEWVEVELEPVPDDLPVYVDPLLAESAPVDAPADAPVSKK